MTCCRTLVSTSVQRLLVKAGITKIKDLRTGGEWKTATELYQETGVKSLRFMEKLLEGVNNVLPSAFRNLQRINPQVGPSFHP